MKCYCSICRKTAGGGGYAINLSAHAESLEVEGREHLSVYQATIDGKQSSAERNFCGKCASALWLWDSRWPELLHPFASAIDSPLPKPPQHVHIMQASLANWVEPDIQEGDMAFDVYPEEAIEDWHRRHDLWEEGGS
jgi:hypothetical protein